MICSIKYFVLVFHLLLTVTFLTSFVPLQTYVSFTLLAFIIGIIFLYTGKINYIKLNIGYTAYIFTLVLYIFFSYFAVFLENEEYGFGLVLPIIYITFFYALLSEIIQKNNFNNILNTYIYIAFILSLISLIGWVIYTAELVDASKWMVNISEYTHNQTHRDVGKLIYSSPYYLGLVLTEGHKYQFPGFSFLYYRSSGFSTEPWYFALFILPSLFFVNSETIKSNISRIIVLVVIGITIIIVSSVTSYLVVFLLMPLYLYKLKLRKSLIIVSLFYIIMFAYILYAYQNKTYLGVTGSDKNNVVLSKMEGLITNPDDPSNPGANIFNLFKTQVLLIPSHYYNPQSKPVGAIHNILILVLLIFGIILGIKLILSNNKYWFLGFGILAFSIALFKGQAHTLITTPFYYFLIWIANYAEKYNLRRDYNRVIKH